MPSQTFYNLPEEKKNQIFDAAIKEFSIHEFSKASINQMIKDAGIPRGSFYMYFEDKKDLVDTILSSYLEGFKEAIRIHLLSSDGSLYEVLMGVHEYLYHLYEEKSNKNFVKNMIFYMQSEFDKPNDLRPKQPLKRSMRKLIPFLNKDQFKIQEEEFIISVLDISFATLKSVLHNSFVHEYTYDQSKEQFISYLEIIQNGYLRK